MKKVYILGIPVFLFFSLLLLGCASSQNFYMKTVASPSSAVNTKMKIAIIPENWYWLGSPNFFPRALITELLDIGFEVIERTQLEKVLGETVLEQKGLTKSERQNKSKEGQKGRDISILDKNSIEELGKLLGVDALLVTYIIPNYDGNIDKATFRLVDIKTGKVMFSTTFVNRTIGTYKISIEKLLPVVAEHIREIIAGKRKVETEYTEGVVKIRSIK